MSKGLTREGWLVAGDNWPMTEDIWPILLDSKVVGNVFSSEIASVIVSATLWYIRPDLILGGGRKLRLKEVELLLVLCITITYMGLAGITKNSR